MLALQAMTFCPLILFSYFYSLLLMMYINLFFLMFLKCNLKFQIQFYFFVLSLISDKTSLFFSIFVLMISLIIMYFSNFYMKMEKNNLVFYHLMVAFILSMIFLIMFPDFPLVILGWDLLGISSFLLVIYYPSKISNSAGMITLMINRIGDIFIIWGIIMMMNFIILKNWICLILLICLLTKSAHFPFSIWLPAAMMAPTPISALVHSSTLVTGGIYLVLRYNKIMMINKYILLMMSMLIVLTSFLGALLGNVEMDGKKIIAYSTLSQLGFILLSALASNFMLSLFHLFMHALFKSFLFIMFGNFMMIFIHSQSYNIIFMFWNMMNNKKMMDISIFSMMGYPFLSGFYSKDMVLENLSNMNYLFFLNILFWFSVIMTSSYSFRLMKMSMKMKSIFKFNLLKIIDKNFEIFILFLFLLTIMGGSYFFFLMMYFFSLYQKFFTLVLIGSGLMLFLLMSNNKIMLKDMNFFFLNNILNKMNKFGFLQSNLLFLVTESGWIEKHVSMTGINLIWINMQKMKMIYLLGGLMLFLFLV